MRREPRNRLGRVGELSYEEETPGANLQGGSEDGPRGDLGGDEGCVEVAPDPAFWLEKEFTKPEVRYPRSEGGGAM